MVNHTHERGLSRREFLRVSLTALGGSVLAACAPQATPVPTAAPPTATPPPKKVTITYAFHDPAAFRAEAVKAFNEEFPNITVKLEEIAEEFPTKIFTAAAAGTLADVVRVWEPHVLEFGRAGQLRDLQPLIDAETDFNPEDFIASFYDFPVIDGKRYGIADGWNAHLGYYNKDLFDAAGVAYPSKDWTWDDLVSLSRQISKPDEGIYGTGMFFGWLHWNYKQIWQNGGQVYNADYTRSLLDSPEAIEAMQFWADLAAEGQIMPGPAGEAPDVVFGAGKAATLRNGSWYIGGLETAEFAWDLLPEPQNKVRATLLHTAFNVIPNTTEETGAAWAWLNFIVGPTGQYLYVKDNVTPGTRKSVNARGPWIREGIEADWDLIPEAGEYGIVVPAPPNVGEVEKLQADAFQAIYLGEKTAEEALTEVAPKVTEALKAAA